MTKLPTKNKLSLCVLLRGINSLPFLIFISSLNMFFINNGFSLKVASDETGMFFSLYYFISVFSGYLIQKGVSIKSFYLTTNYLRTISLILLSLPETHTLTLVFLSLFLSGMAVQQVAILDTINILTQKEDYKRRKIMIFAYVSTNVASLGTFLLSYTFSSFNHINLFFLVYSVFPIISNYIFKHFIYNDEKIISLKRSSLLIFAFIILTFLISTTFLLNPNLGRQMLVVMLFLSFIFFVAKSNKTDNSRNKNIRILLFIFYYTASVLYFAVFYLNTSLILDLIKSATSLSSPQLGMAFDPLTALLFFSIAAWIIKYLKKGSMVIYTTPILFSLGFIIILVAISFLGMLHKNNLGHNTFYIILYIIVLTLGELLLAPEGFSIAGRLLNEKIQSLGIGLWRTFIGSAFLISSELTDQVLNSDSTTRVEVSGLLQGSQVYLVIFILIFLSITMIMEYKIKNRNHL